LKGFDVHFNTLHGLILRLNKWMLQGDTETRDKKTLQGALNALNDLIHRFGAMKPGQLMMVDDTGRMHGTNVSTAQKFEATNYGGQAVEIEKMANQVKKVPDEWINDAGNDVTQEMIDYILPLIQGELPCTFNNGVPVHLRLY
jgi:hypothetical protein